ncbi:MAG: ATP-binding protein [Mariprofundaceae bacterium]|nr:ATP-binding protein [Mariprofundaceae bacterium]
MPSTNKYAYSHNFIPNGYATLNSKGVIVESNPEFGELLGLKCGTLPEGKFSSLLDRKQRGVFEAYCKSIAGSEVPLTCELPLLKQDGDECWVMLTGYRQDVARNDYKIRVLMFEIVMHKHVKDDLLIGEDEKCSIHARDTHDNAAYEHAASNDGHELTGIRTLTHSLLLSQEKRHEKMNLALRDDIGQAVAAIQMYNAGNINYCLRGDCSKAQKGLREGQAVVEKLMKSIRGMLQDSSLAELDLHEALDALIQRKENVGSEWILDVKENANKLPKKVQIPLYQVACEAVDNIRRHAKATKASIKLNVDSGMAKLTIEDNGCGFDIGKTAMGLGLVRMRERGLASGGSVQVKTRTGDGTCISMQLPVIPRCLTEGSNTLPHI